MPTCETIARTCACSNLRMAARAVTQLYDEALRPSGLRATQFNLLVAASLAGGATLSSLGAALAMDRTTLNRNLKPLVGRRLLAVTVARDDARARRVELTGKGRRALAAAIPAWERAQRRVVDRFRPARWRRLLGELHALREQVHMHATRRTP